MSDHAKACAKSTAQTIEALYELHIWDWRTGENPDPMTEEAADILQDLLCSHGEITEHNAHSAIAEWAREMPLSVTSEDGIFEILLCTGGPALRCTGTLFQGEPDWRAGCRPDLQWQDWFQPWTVSDYPVNTDALMWFCCLFHFSGPDCD